MPKDAFSYLLAPVLRAAAAACETAPYYVSSFETLPFSRVCPELRHCTFLAQMRRIAPPPITTPVWQLRKRLFVIVQPLIWSSRYTADTPAV